MGRRILILDTPDGELSRLSQTFADAAGDDAEVQVVTDAEEMLARLCSSREYDLTVVDYFLGDGRRNGVDLLAEIQSVDHDAPVVAVAEEGDVESASRAIHAGATDFLVRGPQLDKRVSTLLGKVRKLFSLLDRNRQLDQQNRLLREAHRYRYQIVGDSPQTKELIQRIERVAQVPRPMLIVGERGTGKELVARAIHEASGPAQRSMIVVNCAAFTDALLESELFGHEKGAFTGAQETSRGKFELADGGTLFLDEIGNMSLSFQQKILRVVEYGAFTRVGGAVELKTTAHIVAATNTDLEERMQSGEFLPDLYDRLSFEILRVPPLRERPEDIEPLSLYFLSQFQREIPAFKAKQLSRSALRVLRPYHFPGNVRELKNIIERAAYRDTTSEITPEDIGLLSDASVDIPGGTFDERVETFRKRLIHEALDQSGGNQAAAARLLGLSYHQFRYYHGKYPATDSE